MPSPSHLQAGQPSSGGGARPGRRQAAGLAHPSPGRRARGQRARGCGPALSVASRTEGAQGGGEQNQNPSRSAPPAPPPAPAAGRTAAPSPPPAAKFSSQLPSASSSPRRPRPTRPRALTRPPNPAESPPEPAAQAAPRGRGRVASGRLPALPALIASRTPGEVAWSRWRPPPRNPRTWRGGEGARTPAPWRAHLSCQGPAAPPRLTHAGATVAQCLSKLLISPGAARRRRRRLGPAGEVELPGPRPRNTCCCRRRRGHTQAQRRPLPDHWLAPGSLTSASGRCRVSAANTHKRARTDGRLGAPSVVTRPFPAWPAR